VGESLSWTAAGQERDRRIGRRALISLRVYFLAVVPVALLVTDVANRIVPPWPYAVIIWASGPAGCIAVLRICRTRERQVPLLVQNVRAVAAVTGGFSILVSALAFLTAPRPHVTRAAAQLYTESLRLGYGVLPALAMSIAAWVLACMTWHRGNYAETGRARHAGRECAQQKELRTFNFRA
jgi:hypothetical protein